MWYKMWRAHCYINLGLSANKSNVAIIEHCWTICSELREAPPGFYKDWYKSILGTHTRKIRDGETNEEKTEIRMVKALSSTFKRTDYRDADAPALLRAYEVERGTLPPFPSV